MEDSITKKLQDIAQKTPNRIAFRHIRKNEIYQEITYQALDAQAKSIAAAFQHAGYANQRVLLVMPQGIDFICAFYGALYAGVVAVPTFPPLNRKQVERIEAIASDAKACAIVSVETILKKLRSPSSSSHAQLLDYHLMQHHDLTYIEPSIGENQTAFLQYTSGSTGQPKGVIVSHQNMIKNTFMIGEVFGDTSADVFGGWLPFFHDMGLISMVIRPICYETSSVFMDPADFIRHPLSWLQMIDRFGITDCGGPNFGYDLCVRAAQRLGLPEGLDLSRWRVAYNGAEQVRPSTLRDFESTFAALGFKKNAFLPCYGMAESTLFITGLPGADAPRQLKVDPEHYRPLTDTTQNGLEISSCGVGSVHQTLCLVDPDSKSLCDSGEVGEVWVSGVHIAQGYWGKPDLTQDVFQAYTSCGKGPFLRTGDLGFLHAGELYITGRIKDLIIIRGKNYAPQEIEWLCTETSTALRHNGAAAFSVPSPEGEALVLVSETTRELSASEREEVKTHLSAAIAQHFGIFLYDLILIEKNQLPRTTSGKVRRKASQQAYLNRQFPTQRRLQEV